jgi:hypothetical protein
MPEYKSKKYGKATYSKNGNTFTATSSATATSTLSQLDADAIAQQTADEVASSNAEHDYNVSRQSTTIASQNTTSTLSGTPNLAGATFTQASVPSSGWTGIAMSSDGQYQTSISNQTGTTTTGYIYVSSNYGSTWTQYISGVWIGIAMSNNGQYQTAISNPGYIYVSSTYGSTWTQILTDASNNPITTTNWTCVAVSPDGVYQVAGSSSGLLYMSSDSGVSWVLQSVSVPPLGWNALAAGVNTSTYYISAATTSTSTNPFNGILYTYNTTTNTWSSAVSGVNIFNIAMSSNGQYQTFTTNTSPVFPTYFSSDYGSTWTSQNLYEVDLDNYLYRVSMDYTGEYQTLTGIIKQSIQIPGQFSGVAVSTNYGANWSYISAPTPLSYRPWTYCAIVNDGTYAYQTISSGNSDLLAVFDGTSWSQNNQSYSGIVAMGLNTTSTLNTIYTTVIQNPGYIYTSSTSYTPPSTTNQVYGLKGSISTGTNNSYMWNGTQPIQSGSFPDPTGAHITISKPGVLSKMFVDLKAPAGLGNIVSITIEYTPVGGVLQETPYAITLAHPNTNATLKNKNLKLQIGDKIHVKVSYTGGTTNAAKDLTVQLVFA